MKIATRAVAPLRPVGGRRARSWHAEAASRVGWGLGDQALSSVTNFAVGILVAKSVSIPDFGAYALAFSAYCFILGISRALSTEPFAVRFTIADPDALQRARAAVAGVAVLTGTAFLALSVVLSQLLPADHRSLVLCLGFVLPGLLVQDSTRQILFAAGRGRSAFNNDLLWAVLIVPAFGLVFLSGSVNAATLILAWGAAASLAAVAGCFQCRVVPGVRITASWLQSQRGLWPRYLFEGALINGSQQIVFLALGVFAGLSAVGEMKLVLVLLGPVNVLVQGIGVVAVPEVARAIAVGRARFLRVTAGFSLAVAAGALSWGLTVMMMPVSWGGALVGQGWLAASALVIPMFLVQVFNGANTGLVVGIRGMGAARKSMWTRTATSSLVVISSVAGAATAGVQGAAWGLALAAALNAVLWYLQFRNVMAQYPFETAKSDFARRMAGRSQAVEVVGSPMNESWSVWQGAKQVVSMQWSIIVAFTLVGVLIGAGLALRNPVIYTARAELVTGNYSLPAEVASQPAIAKAGALGLELPAETQARIIASPTIVDVAAQTLRLDDRASSALRASVKATATTDNSFAISAAGSSPEEASENVNAVAAAFLQYRADIGRADMNVLAERAHAAARDSLASAASLADPLANAQATNPGYAASILAKREELEHAASSAESIAAALDDAVKDFNGGGSVVRPATAGVVEESPSMLMFILLGLAVGLMGGVAFAAVRRQVSDRIMDRRDVSRATGLTEVFELGGQRGGYGAVELLLRSVEQSSTRLGISSAQIAVRPLTHAKQGAPGLLGLAAGGRAVGKSVAIAALSRETGSDLTHELGVGGGSTTLRALAGHMLATVNSEIGCEASAVFGTTPTPTGTYDLLLLATGPHFEAGNEGSLPAAFSGPTVLVVRVGKDRIQDLEQAVGELNAANLPVLAVLMADQTRDRARKEGFGRSERTKARGSSPEPTSTSPDTHAEMPNVGAERTSRTTAGTKS